MKKNFLLGLAEMGTGIVLALPFEDIPAGGTTAPFTLLAGMALFYDGLRRI